MQQSAEMGMMEIDGDSGRGRMQAVAGTINRRKTMSMLWAACALAGVTLGILAVKWFGGPNVRGIAECARQCGSPVALAEGYVIRPWRYGANTAPGRELVIRGCSSYSSSEVDLPEGTFVVFTKSPVVRRAFEKLLGPDRDRWSDEAPMFYALDTSANLWIGRVERGNRIEALKYLDVPFLYLSPRKR